VPHQPVDHLLRHAAAGELGRKELAEGVRCKRPLAVVHRGNARGVPFTLEDVRALILAAEAREASTDGRVTMHGPLASTYYAFLTLTGARRREGRMQLRSDVDLDRGLLYYTADKARRGDGIPLPVECVAALRTWMAWCDEQIAKGKPKFVARSEYLFPELPSHITLQADMKTCGIPGWEQGDAKKARGFWHRFRKCAVTERASRGADVRNLHHFARHENLETTLNIYDYAKVEELRPTAELMPRLNGFLDRNILGNDKKGLTRGQGDDDTDGGDDHKPTRPKRTREQPSPAPAANGRRSSPTPAHPSAGGGLDCSHGLEQPDDSNQRLRQEFESPCLHFEGGKSRLLLESVVRAHESFLALVARMMPGASDEHASLRPHL
jgi:integrase